MESSEVQPSLFEILSTASVADKIEGALRGDLKSLFQDHQQLAIDAAQVLQRQGLNIILPESGPWQFTEIADLAADFVQDCEGNLSAEGAVASAILGQIAVFYELWHNPTLSQVDGLRRIIGLLKAAQFIGELQEDLGMTRSPLLEEVAKYRKIRTGLSAGGRNSREGKIDDILSKKKEIQNDWRSYSGKLGRTQWVLQIACKKYDLGRSSVLKAIEGIEKASA